MQTLPGSFVKQFRHHWKELRKSDPRLAREFGLTVDEVLRIKGMLIGDTGSTPFFKEEERGMISMQPAEPTPIRRSSEFEREPRDIPLPSEKPKTAPPHSKGLFASVYSGLTESASKMSRGVLSRVSDLVFEENATTGQNEARIQPIRRPPPDRDNDPPECAKEMEMIHENVRLGMPSEYEADSVKEKPIPAPVGSYERRSGITNATIALQKIQETVEKVELDQEIERRLSAVAARVATVAPERTPPLEPERFENDATDCGPLSFNSALDEVLYKQALKKLLHDRKEIRCNGIVEIERIGKTNRAAIHALYPMMQDYETDVRAQVLISLINLDAREAMSLFREAMNDENARVRMAAIRGMHKFSGKSPSQFLSLALTDESAEVREITAQYIGGNGDSKSISEIIDLLGKERNASVRRTLVRTIASMREKSTIPCLISMLNDPSEEFRSLAAGVLEDLTHKKFDFDGRGAFPEREKGIEEIKQWWGREKESFRIRAKATHEVKREQKNVMPAPPKQDEKAKSSHSARETVPAAETVSSKNKLLPAESVPVSKLVEPKPVHVDKQVEPAKPVLFHKIIRHDEPVKIPETPERHTEKSAVADPDKAESTGRHSGKRKQSAKLDYGALGL